MTSPITVTQPHLPPLEEFTPYLEKIWASRRLTNGGNMHQALEAALADYLGVTHLSLFANGTLALLTALQALRIKGEVITTPYSFVATSHTLLWNDLTPVFVDIEPDSFQLDPRRIEEAITPHTDAILPVHCYGLPCDTQAIQRIADIYGLKVIYDAAHAFGVHDGQGSLLQHGDLSVLSFHATKVFNTFEGGAIICHDAKTKQRIDYLKNFGFADETTVVAPGINAKLNEVSSAFGLLQLDYIDDALMRRKQIFQRYADLLNDIEGLEIMAVPKQLTWNYAYCPLMVTESFPLDRDTLYHRLQQENILARRYFYPLISDFPMYRGLDSAQPGRLPHAHALSRRILCLPLYPDLSETDQTHIIDTLKTAARS